MSGRAARAQIASETLAILENGEYASPSGRTVSIRGWLDAARRDSALYVPAQLEALRAQGNKLAVNRCLTAFAVNNETTLGAARRLAGEGARVCALNFASARNPGGGFLKGSQAQEESLARSTGLYTCIHPFGAMYDANREHSSCLYTDHIIYSPDVPVFRDDDDALLDEPYRVSFLTAPAVNAGAVRAHEPHNVARIAPTMRARVAKVLAVAVRHGHDTLVLGAWGCGVFGNDPDAVAGWFADALTDDDAFRGAFRTVVFAVLDGTPERSVIRPFERRFPRPA